MTPAFIDVDPSMPFPARFRAVTTKNKIAEPKRRPDSPMESPWLRGKDLNFDLRVMS